MRKLNPMLSTSSRARVSLRCQFRVSGVVSRCSRSNCQQHNKKSVMAVSQATKGSVGWKTTLPCAHSSQYNALPLRSHSQVDAGKCLEKFVTRIEGKAKQTPSTLSLNKKAGWLSEKSP